jgi:hypothetical protein
MNNNTCIIPERYVIDKRSVSPCWPLLNNSTKPWQYFVFFCTILYNQNKMLYTHPNARKPDFSMAVLGMRIPSTAINQLLQNWNLTYKVFCTFFCTILYNQNNILYTHPNPIMIQITYKILYLVYYIFLIRSVLRTTKYLVPF